MLYYSTNHKSEKVSLKEAILRSEASDGGLYMPERLPVLPKAFINNIPWMTLKDIAYVIGNTLMGDDVAAAELKRIADDCASYPMPLYEIEEGIYVMELFHGPTKTVKDFGARILTNLIHEFTKDESTPLNVIVPTIGHTGNAIANALKDHDGVNVFVLYPKGRSADHIEPLSVLGDNIHVIEVNGSIDDCVALTEKAFSDPSIKELMTLTSANSLNIGSLLPMTIPFFHAYAQLASKCGKAKDVHFAVPTGNGGNLLAGYIAKHMGLPITRLTAACNANGGFHRYLTKGENDRRALIQRTYAYGMDIGFNANAPRFEELCNHDTTQLHKDIGSEICTDAEIAEAVLGVYSRTGYLLDPHSAAAYIALKRQLEPGSTGILMATSHPSLSIAVLDKINDGSLRLPFRMKSMNYCVRPETRIHPAYGALKKYLKYYGCTGFNESCFA